MTKRLFSLVLMFLLVIGISSFTRVNSLAGNDAYSVSKALEYAHENWDNGVGLCADFASKCLQAGGIDIYGQTVQDLYEKLKDEYGTAYRLKLTNGTSGKIDMSENQGKVSKGDPIFYKCNYCGEFEHVVICNGENSEGYSQDYAHNNAHNGQKTTYTYNHCGGDSWAMYSIRMYERPKLYGEKSSVTAPEISSLGNSGDGILIKWKAVANADKYIVYRKTEDSSWQRIGVTKDSKFTDKKAENGVKYVYTLRAVDGKTVSQYYAGEELTCIAAPVLSSVKNNDSNVKLTWKAVPSAEGYYVYRKGKSGSWKQIAKIEGGEKVSFTDKEVKSSETYRYTVRAYVGNIKGCYSKSGIKTIYLDTPDNLTAKNYKKGISIKFNKVEGAKKYIIYRKNSQGNWKRIGYVKNGEKAAFMDRNVTVGKTYTYTVKAVRGDYTSSYSSKGVKSKY